MRGRYGTSRRRRGAFLGPVLVTLVASGVAAPARAEGEPAPVEDPAALVNPFIGTTNAGNVYPGAVLPFGMLSWSPTTTRGNQAGAGAAGGYHYDVTRIRGLGLTHMSGTGCTPGASGDIPIMPHVGGVTSSPSADSTDVIYASDFSHANEVAQPGYYRVGLASGASAELTTTPRTGSGRFSFPAGRPATLLFRASNSLSGSANATVSVDPGHSQVTGSVDSGGFCGAVAAVNRRVYYRLHFVAEFDRPIAGFGTWVDGSLRPNTTSARGGEGFTSRAGRGSGAYVGFDSGQGRTVGMRVGISYVSLANAQANLEAENPPGRSFDTIRADARAAWNTWLSRIGVAGGTTAQRTIFYTALYHALLQPSLFSDVTGEYLGSDLRTYRVEAGQDAQYGTFSGWDVYRAQVQLLALLEPRIAGDYAQSLLNFARQRGGEWDRWLHNNGKTSVMSGDPSAPAVAGMYAFGATGFDAAGALRSLVTAANVPTANDRNSAGCPVSCVGQRPALDQYLRIRYVPADNCHCWGAAAETLEDVAADYGLAMLSHRLGDATTRDSFLRRSGYWHNVFDPNATPAGGYVRNRRANGGWIGGFTPGTEIGFVEGTSAQYTWMIYHDVVGLAAAMGGNARAAARLDGFFHRPDGSWDLTGTSPTRYDAGNEPSMQTPWLYTYLGRPHQTQETVRQILTTLWTTATGGVPGNDDLGTMSSWYVFSALGLYPQIPSRAELLLSAPLFPRAEIRRGNGVTIVIDAPQAAMGAKYVHSLRVNGQASTKAWVPESFVRGGGTLHYILGFSPNPSWGSAPADLPPQTSQLP